MQSRRLSQLPGVLSISRPWRVMRRRTGLPIGIPFVHEFHFRFQVVVLEQGRALNRQHRAREAGNEPGEFLAVLIVRQSVG